MTQRNVLVTGANGFLGANLVRALLADGHRVTGTVRPGSSGSNLLGLTGPFSVATLDLSEPAGFDATLKAQAPEIVINMGAYGVDPRQNDPRLLAEINVTGAARLLAACARRKVERFIQIGSCFEYGSSDRPMAETCAVSPLSAYGSSKAAATVSILSLASALKIEACVLRPFGMWGRFEPAFRLVPQILAAAKSGQRLALTDGSQVRDLSFVADMAARLSRLAVHPDLARTPVVNVGSGVAVPIRDFAFSVAEAAGAEKLLDFGALPQRGNEVPSIVADVSVQTSLIGTLPVTAVKGGVAKLLEQAT